jgi:hypothetical protein
VLERAWAAAVERSEKPIVRSILVAVLVARAHDLAPPEKPNLRIVTRLDACNGDSCGLRVSLGKAVRVQLNSPRAASLW